MVEAKFSFGEEEKHEIQVSYSLWTGQLKVKIDEKRVTGTWHLGITKVLNYKIGDKEVHEVMVKISGIFVPSIEVYVNGKLLSKV